MPIDEKLNAILKRMWTIKEKINSHETLIYGDKTFFNKHLRIIKKYYRDQSKVWRNTVYME